MDSRDHRSRSSRFRGLAGSKSRRYFRPVTKAPMQVRVRTDDCQLNCDCRPELLTVDSGLPTESVRARRGHQSELFQLRQRLVRLLPDFPQLAVSAHGGRQSLEAIAARARPRSDRVRRGSASATARTLPPLPSDVAIHQHLADLFVDRLTGTGGPNSNVRWLRRRRLDAQGRAPLRGGPRRTATPLRAAAPSPARPAGRRHYLPLAFRWRIRGVTEMPKVPGSDGARARRRDSDRPAG